MALAPVVGRRLRPGLRVVDGSGHRSGRPGRAPVCCCSRCLEDSFPQRQFHYPLQLHVVERIRRHGSHHGLRRLA
ncbi:MAG: hypothetical protein ACK56F_17445, partial [bacterium]